MNNKQFSKHSNTVTTESFEDHPILFVQQSRKCKRVSRSVFTFSSIFLLMIFFFYQATAFIKAASVNTVVRGKKGKVISAMALN